MLFHYINKRNLSSVCGSIVIIFGIFFALFMTKAKKDGEYGYKIDNKERVKRIFSEIQLIIKPYQISNSESFTRGPTTFVTFYVKGSVDELKNLNLLIDKRKNNFGFINSCRHGESLMSEYKVITEFDKSVKVEFLAIKWKYPDSSCNTNSQSA